MGDHLPLFVSVFVHTSDLNWFSRPPGEWEKTDHSCIFMFWMYVYWVFTFAIILTCIVSFCLSAMIPEGWPGMSVWCHPPVWNLRAVIWSLISFLACFSWSSCPFCLVIFPLTVHSVHFVNSPTFFDRREAFLYGSEAFMYGSNWAARRWCFGGGMQIAARWHWYLPLCIYIISL